MSPGKPPQSSASLPRAPLSTLFRLAAMYEAVGFHPQQPNSGQYHTWWSPEGRPKISLSRRGLFLVDNLTNLELTKIQEAGYILMRSFSPLNHLKGEDQPIIWATPSGGSLYKEHRRRKVLSIPSLVGESVWNSSIDSGSFETGSLTDWTTTGVSSFPLVDSHRWTRWTVTSSPLTW